MAGALIDTEKCFKGEHGTLCLGDTRRLIEKIPSRSIDAIITDPPWGVMDDPLDNPDVFYEIEDEMWRVLKNDAWLIFYYTPRNIPYICRFKKFRYVWIIPYVFHGESSARNPFGVKVSYSIIVVMKKGEPKIRRKRSDIIQADELPFVEENPKNPLFKPTSVTTQLLYMFTDENNVVLDPFAGFGSILLVCELFNRKWIGFEADPVRYEVACEILRRKTVLSIPRLLRKHRETGGKKVYRRSIPDFFK